MAAIAFWLVGVVTDPANIEISGLGKVGFIIETEVGMPNNIEARIQKTSLNNKGLLSIDKVLIDFGRGNFGAEIITAEASGRKNDLSSGDRRGHLLAFLKKLIYSFDGFSPVSSSVVSVNPSTLGTKLLAGFLPVLAY